MLIYYLYFLLIPQFLVSRIFTVNKMGCFFSALLQLSPTYTIQQLTTKISGQHSNLHQVTTSALGCCLLWVVPPELVSCQLALLLSLRLDSAPLRKHNRILHWALSFRGRGNVSYRRPRRKFNLHGNNLFDSKQIVVRFSSF